MSEADVKLNINLICDICNHPLSQPILEKSLTKSNEDSETIVIRVIPCGNCPSIGITLAVNINNEKIQLEF